MIWGETGSRHGATNAQLVSVVWLWYKYGIYSLHNGDCKGFDSQTFFMAKAFGAELIMHPPKNGEWRAWNGTDDKTVTMLPVGDYFVRDRAIVNVAEVMVAASRFSVEPEHGGGTWFTINYTRKQGKPLAIIWPNGFITYENWTL